MRKLLTALLLIAACAVLAGCSPASASELYSLPQLPDEYISLQTLIDAELAEGSEYSSPTGGSNLQAVQQYDLNGDGISEALAFFRTASGALKICVYGSVGGEYEQLCSISGEGSFIGRIDYTDMDGDGTSELIAAWQLDGGITLIGAYSMKNWSGETLLTANCTAFTEISLGAEGEQLVVLRYDAENQGYIDMYTLKSDGEVLLSSAKLSRGFDTVAELKSGTLAEGESALFVEGIYMGTRTITDVFTAADGEIHNISATSTGISPTTRSYPVYSEDINVDGITEIPTTRLAASPDGEERWIFEWKRLHADGRMETAVSTYHSYEDGWYVSVDLLAGCNIYIEREETPTASRVLFSNLDDSGWLTELFSIETYTGDYRAEQAAASGGITLGADETAAYALHVIAPWLDGDTLAEGFGLIHSGWQSSAAKTGGDL